MWRKQLVKPYLVIFGTMLFSMIVYFNKNIKRKCNIRCNEKNTHLETNQGSINPYIATLGLSNKKNYQVEIIRRDCGMLCNTSRAGIHGKYFNQTTTPIDCSSIFTNEFIDTSHDLKHAPRKIPIELWNDFTMGGSLKVTEFYFDQPYVGNLALSSVWTRTLLSKMINAAHNGNLNGTYGHIETNALRDGLRHAPGIREGRVLVIGSENPWVEACVLEAGAREIVTLEYGKILSEHPQIKPITPFHFRKQYLNNTLGQFDAVVTFSSVEHTGLGRYGDILNPWGDIIAIARAWCVTKENGSLTIGVMYDYNNDRIRFNADRIYGKIRYPYLVTNWEQLYRGGGSQRVHVFKKLVYQSY